MSATDPISCRQGSSGPSATIPIASMYLGMIIAGVRVALLRAIISQSSRSRRLVMHWVRWRLALRLCSVEDVMDVNSSMQ